MGIIKAECYARKLSIMNISVILENCRLYCVLGHFSNGFGGHFDNTAFLKHYVVPLTDFMGGIHENWLVTPLL